MIYAVIDTNVIVSAYITKNLRAATSKVWEAVLQGKIIPVYSDEMIDEYNEVLHREKFGIPEHVSHGDRCLGIPRICPRDYSGDFSHFSHYSH